MKGNRQLRYILSLPSIFSPIKLLLRLFNGTALKEYSKYLTFALLVVLSAARVLLSWVERTQGKWKGKWKWRRPIIK